MHTSLGDTLEKRTFVVLLLERLPDIELPLAFLRVVVVGDLLLPAAVRVRL